MLSMAKAVTFATSSMAPVISQKSYDCRRSTTSALPGCWTKGHVHGKPRRRAITPDVWRGRRNGETSTTFRVTATYFTYMTSAIFLDFPEK
jgi:hypothetical protein